MILRVRFSADANGKQRVQYGEFSSVEDIAATADDIVGLDDFEACEWSCDYSSLCEVGEPYLPWVLSLLEQGLGKGWTMSAFVAYTPQGGLPKNVCFTADILFYEGEKTMR